MISAKTIKKTALAPTVLISHGGGFLAAHLAQTLLLKNCRVVVLSNLERYPDPHLQKLLKSTKFALFDCDINTELPKAIESVDYIFHLANYDTFLPAQTNPDLEGLLSAGVGTKHLLDLAKESRAK
ncbi:NAD-dependent epimerase/dehydratase family protein, partial [Patescibacteria group bacterium]|nr:NAD-dependent epimerase/dehydratase family protein [Patescibacteria group bacterium]MBU1970253.1 NAD-dependent epimerase/dehydratase family protein [Patescibacteria group bacterium]